LAVKRGRGAEHVDFDEAIFMSDEMSEEIVMLDEALTKLARIEERKAMVVKLRYFGGFKLEEIASILDISQITVERDWRFARSWLKREISGED
jgi:RNA polymerase sigma factor (TIGR02999 family)